MTRARTSNQTPRRSNPSRAASKHNVSPYLDSDDLDPSSTANTRARSRTRPQSSWFWPGTEPSDRAQRRNESSAAAKHDPSEATQPRSHQGSINQLGGLHPDDRLTINIGRASQPHSSTRERQDVLSQLQELPPDDHIFTDGRLKDLIHSRRPPPISSSNPHTVARPRHAPPTKGIEIDNNAPNSLTEPAVARSAKQGIDRKRAATDLSPNRRPHIPKGFNFERGYEQKYASGGHLKIGDLREVKAFFAGRFDLIENYPCKTITRALIMEILPSKRAGFPYAGKSRQVLSNDDRPAPAFWPDEIPWNQVDALKTEKLTPCLVHLLTLPETNRAEYENILYNHIYCNHKNVEANSRPCHRSWEAVWQNALQKGTSRCVAWLADKGSSGESQNSLRNQRRSAARVEVLEELIRIAGEFERAVVDGEWDLDSTISYDAVPQDIFLTPVPFKRQQAHLGGEIGEKGRNHQARDSPKSTYVEDADGNLTEMDSDDDRPETPSTMIPSTSNSFGDRTYKRPRMTTDADIISTDHSNEGVVSRRRQSPGMTRDAASDQTSLRPRVAHPQPPRIEQPSTIVPNLETSRCPPPSFHRSGPSSMYRSVSASPRSGVAYKDYLEGVHGRGEHAPSLLHVRDQYVSHNPYLTSFEEPASLPNRSNQLFSFESQGPLNSPSHHAISHEAPAHPTFGSYADQVPYPPGSTGVSSTGYRGLAESGAGYWEAALNQPLDQFPSSPRYCPQHSDLRRIAESPRRLSNAGNVYNNNIQASGAGLMLPPARPASNYGAQSNGDPGLLHHPASFHHGPMFAPRLDGASRAVTHDSYDQPIAPNQMQEGQSAQHPEWTLPSQFTEPTEYGHALPPLDMTWTTSAPQSFRQYPQPPGCQTAPPTNTFPSDNIVYGNTFPQSGNAWQYYSNGVPRGNFYTPKYS